MMPEEIKVEILKDNVEPVPVTYEPEQIEQRNTPDDKGADAGALIVSEQQEVGPADPDSMNVLTLSKTYDFDGRPLRKIDLNLDQLTARDLQKATRMLELSGELNPMAIMPEFTVPFILRLVSISSKLPIEFLSELSYKDAMALKMRVLAFFGASD